MRTLLFFRAVYKKYHSEAEVQLHYNSGSSEFLLHCPEQQVTGASVKYSSKERFEGFQLIGTIHSHSDFGASHSGIDQSDERYFDGLHITIGHVDQPYFTISCSMMVNGQRFTFEPEEVIIGVKKVDWKEKSFLTHRRLKVSHLPTPPVQSSGLIDRFFDRVIGADLSAMDFSSLTNVTSYTRSEQFWDIALPEGQDYRHIGFPKHWLERAKPLTFIKAVTSGVTPAVTSCAASSTSQPAISEDARSFEEDSREIGDGGYCFWGPNNRGLGF